MASWRSAVFSTLLSRARQISTRPARAASARLGRLAGLGGLAHLVLQAVRQPMECQASRPSRAAAYCSGSAAKLDSRIMTAITVVPYGVLGSSSAGAVASPPGKDTAFVDPAGLHHIQGSGPAGAGGAAGAIYRWLGIAEDTSFPEDVKAAIRAPLQAQFHAYGEGRSKKCIHVVGPDFRSRRYTRDEAVEELAEAYRNVLAQFSGTGLRVLRLLPVSGGIFSGPFKAELPAMTAEALQAAFAKLSIEQQDRVLSSRLELCIFMASDMLNFEIAFAS
eukprot:gb/GFBE01016030.1/.p1 GENE.gb/GFBE01016030.1/~~gb/GFBE01016030.1/.p1  ORF type:complete len:277 (+),score=44.45 gb/GFBE01016030.1/:1-831(+)